MSATLAAGLTPVRAELDNGTAVIVQQTSMTPAVTISASFRAGSLLDPPGLEGRAYLTGLVLDRGTARRTAAALSEELDERGVSLKVSTSRHALTISCTCLSEDFPDLLGIVSDVVRRPVFPGEEIVLRRDEAVTLLRQRADNPGSRAVDAVMELLYGPRHPYGRPSKGTLAGIERVTRDDMVAFHANYVVPAALSLVIVGDVDAADALDLAARELDGWDGVPAPPAAIPPPPPRAARTQVVVDMPGKPQADIVYGFTALRRTDPRYYACWMMNHVLGQFGLGGRLADNIRERQGMAYYAFSTLDSLAGEAPLLVRAGVDPANVGRALAAIDEEVAAMAAAGPTRRELEETRAYLVGSIPRLLETNQSIASFLQSVEEFGLGLDFDRRLPGILNAVTLDEVVQAAGLLDAARAAVAVAGPQS